MVVTVTLTVKPGFDALQSGVGGVESGLADVCGGFDVTNPGVAGLRSRACRFLSGVGDSLFQSLICSHRLNASLKAA
jgi:hypothetical protein